MPKMQDKGKTTENASKKGRKNNIHFLKTDASKRNDVEYRRTDAEYKAIIDKLQKDKNNKNFFHHRGRTILAEIPSFNLVDDVVVDVMHLYYNIVKALMLKYIGPRGRLVKDDRLFVATRLEELERPSEFACKPRQFFKLSSWKATELRQFILYTGVVVLRGYLPAAEYLNFSSLCIIFRLLNDDRFYEDSSSLPKYVEDLIKHFLAGCVSLYGPEFVTHTVHILLHLPRDCLRFGKPEKFSCFPFEDMNYKLTNAIVSGKKPVEQMRNRYEEAIFSGLLSDTTTLDPQSR